MANPFVHWDASVPYGPARNSFLSQWSRGEASSANKYVIADAEVGVSRNAAISRLLADSIVSPGRNDLRAELDSLNKILDILRAEEEMVSPPFAQMAQDVPDLTINSLQQQGEQISARSANASTNSMASSNMPFSPLWFFVVAGIALVLFVVCVLMFRGGVKHLEEDGQEAIDIAQVFGSLCCNLRPELHLMNFWILLFIVGGFWCLWAFNIMQPVLSQIVCYVYFIIVILLLVVIAYYELRYEILDHIKPEYKKFQAVFHNTVGAAEEVEKEKDKVEKEAAKDMGLDCFKGKNKKGCC
jgi:hypothetical protein